MIFSEGSYERGRLRRKRQIIICTGSKHSNCTSENRSLEQGKTGQVVMKNVDT